MPTFVRAFVPGGTFFFTVVTFRRRPLFRQEKARTVLREAIERVRGLRPFTMEAMVLIPDHVHCLWTLPTGDADFSTRWRKIKEYFTRRMRKLSVNTPRIPQGQAGKGQRGYWQQRFWEHAIRDEEDFRRHAEYIHFNPVKHGLVECPHQWPWSSFSRWVAGRMCDADWCCQCRESRRAPPDFADIGMTAGE